jgi:hypothetical protein
MAKPTNRDGFCAACGTPVRSGEAAVIPDSDYKQGYRILCLKCMPDGSLDPPKPPETSKLPSIHRDRFDGPT